MAQEALSLVLFAVCLAGCASSPDQASSAPAGSPTSAPPASASSAEPKPDRVVMARANYAPNPDIRALQQTKAARVLKSDGTVVIGFCVDTRGKTTDIRVIEPFPGDPGVDEVLLATVETWRFRPFRVDGRPIKTCSQKTFVLRFKGAESPAPKQALVHEVCAHIKDRTLAAEPEISEAELDQLLHRCVADAEAERHAVGDAAFERLAVCILGAESIEAIVACAPAG